MKLFGLLGQSLSHSYSPQIHRSLGLSDYRLFEVPPEGLASFLERKDIWGLNVTIPYKKSVIPFCRTLSEAARSIGSVNTMIRNEAGHWEGHNTDLAGFIYLLEKAGLDPQGKKVLVLGSGGASLAVVAALKYLKAAEMVVVSRTGEQNYENIEQHCDAHILVQSTPVGMFPNNHEQLVHMNLFPKCQGVVDLIYNPLRTRLVLEARERGIKAVGGLAMLCAQARAAGELFQQKKLAVSLLEGLTKELEGQMGNIVLIGMPGCGKSTLGPVAAEKLGKTFVDTDQVLTERLGAEPSDIIETHGEAVFRRHEEAVMAEFGKKSAQVIATGGGVVTRPENYAHLAQQGTIIWIQRPVEALPDLGRVLSQRHGVAELYATRRPLYAKFADIIVKNEELESALSQIIEVCSP